MPVPLPFSITGYSQLCLVIGDPISHSLSPAMHNAAYAATGTPFVMAAAQVSKTGLPEALRGVRALGVRGLACTMPHKVAIVSLLDKLDPVAAEIGAINTVVSIDGELIGYNTDWIGIVNPLERLTSLEGKRVAVLGAGGAALAAVYGCIKRGAAVTVYNRSQDNAQALAERFRCSVGELNNTQAIASAEIIINTTAVGMADLASESPLPADVIRSNQIVFETIYAPYTTTLLHYALAANAQVLRGLDMFLEQGASQFEIHTGVKAPRNEMERILQSVLKA